MKKYKITLRAEVRAAGAYSSVTIFEKTEEVEEKLNKISLGEPKDFLVLNPESNLDVWIEEIIE